jgi:hypothetical protein
MKKRGFLQIESVKIRFIRCAVRFGEFNKKGRLKTRPVKWRWRDAFRTFSWRGSPLSATIFSKKLNSKEVGYV